MQSLSAFQYYFRSIISLITGFEKPFDILNIFFDVRKGISKRIPIRLKHHDIVFFVRHAMDVWSIKETFFDDFYHFERNSQITTGIILDIGAGIGEFAILAARACPGCKVFGFEPFPESFEYFQQNIRSNNLTNAFPIEAAVTSKPGTMVMDISSGNPLQFSTQTNAASSVPVNMVMLLDFLKNNSIESVDLLKIDCEGGEFDILLPLKPTELTRFKRVALEYHDSLTVHRHAELVSHFKSAGFSVEVVPNDVHSDLGYIYAQYNR